MPLSSRAWIWVSTPSLELIQILLSSNRCGVRVTQGGAQAVVLLASRVHFPFEALILHACLFQRLLHLLLSGKGVRQFLVRLYQRAGILVNGTRLLLLLAAQQGQPCFRTLNGLFKVRNPRTCQLESALGFLDLLVDGTQVAAEVIAVQGQRHHQIAQDFAHENTSNI